MNKKVKDLTVAELYEYCQEQESCDDCPLGQLYFCTLSPFSYEEETLEQEIEIPEEDEE